MTKPSGKAQTQSLRPGERFTGCLFDAGKMPGLVALFLLLMTTLSSFAQTQLLLKETFTREYAVFVGDDLTTPDKQITSRDTSLFIGTDPVGVYPQAISRETSLVVTTPATPATISQLLVTVSPTGDSATLNWSSYNEVSQNDVVTYLIYLSNGPFTNVTGMTPYLRVPAGTQLLTITNLPVFQDHYFAVVAEDELGNYNPVVSYAAAYILTAQAFSREYCVFVGGNQSNLYPQTVSREVSAVISTPAPPAVVPITVTATPTGDGASLNWSTYDEDLQEDVVRYNIYISSQPFTNVSGLTPYTTVSAGTFAVMVSNLTAFQDHYFAVVAVDAQGGLISAVNYSAAYVLTAQTFSREYNVFVGGNGADPYPQAISRETSIVVPDNSVPDPVTGISSGFMANTSVSAFSAIDLDWSSYDEAIENDVVRYRVYVADSFFTNVSDMTPYEFAPAGNPHFTVTGLHGGDIYYVAVVAESAVGNFNPTVRAVSAQASVGALGDVQNVSATSFSNSLHFTWIVPVQVDAFLAHYNIYFNSATNPLSLPATTTSYDATNLQFATGYPFRITTVDTFGTESAGVSVLGATLLNNPSPVVTESLGNLVRVTWLQVEPNNLVQAYNVYESPTAFTNVTGLSPVVTTRGTRGDVSGLVNGTSYFFAVTAVNIDGGENKVVQSVSAAPNAVAGTFADLAITNVIVPATAYSGQVITISWAVTNIGAGSTSTQNGSPVSAWNDRVVLSSDNTFGDADDVILTNVTHSGALSFAHGYIGITAVQIPANLTGDFNVFVMTDAGDAVFENLDQGTNIAEALHQIEVSAPVPPSITQQPLNETVFEGATTSFSVTAQGSQPLAFQWFHGTMSLPFTTNSSLILTNVQFSDAGNYFVQVSNIAGLNNSMPASLTVNVPPPDLFVTGIQSPSTILAGQPVAVSWMITNGGFSMANAPWQEELLVANNPAGTNATVVLTITSSNSLAANNAVTRSPTVILPAGLSGNYWLAVLVDSANQVTEGNEGNNYFVAPTPVLIQSPDLSVAKFTTPGTALLGQTFNVSYVITNKGNGTALSGWNDRIFLSPSSSLVPGAVALQTVASPVNTLAAGGSYTNSASVTVPFTPQSQAGSYWLIVQADADNSITESVEANNILASALTLTVPPLPDLVVGQVTAPSQASIGATIPISWSVTNIGVATLSNSWRESVYLVPSSLTLGQFSTNLSAYPLLGSFTYTNDLAANGSVTRNEQAAIPQAGPAGGLRVAVFVDSENVIPEQNESNNIALAQNIITVPAALSLMLPVTNVAENTSSPNLTSLVERNGSTASALVVSLSSSAPGHLSVPAIVTIAAGATSVSFNTTVLDNGIADPDALVTISAQASGFVQANSQVLVMNTDAPHLSLSPVSQITEGQTINVTISSDTTMTQPVVVAISSSNPSRLSTPASATIPAGSNSVSFTLLAVDNTTIDPPTSATLSAAAPGFISAVANLSVVDNDAPMLMLALDRTNISEGDGPFAAVGTITRIPVTDQPVTVALASSNTAAATVPATVTIPALQSQGTFYVVAVADNIVTGPKLTLLSAQSLDVASNPTGFIATEELVVQDTNGPALGLTIANRVVSKGLNPATTATVSRNTPATSNLVVHLSLSVSNEVSLPATVVISNGQSSATFPIASLDDGLSNTNQSVAINASATNVASATAVMMVTDLGLPDLVINSVTAPATAFTGEPLTVSFRLLNQGLGTLTNSVAQNVYLTPAVNSGTNLLVGAATYGSQLQSGQFVDQFVVVPGTAVPPPGTYYVVVAADAGNNATELNELNNQTISSTPVVITSEYTATVKAGVTNVAAGTPVPLSGSATLVAGGPAANKPVNILLTVRGFERTISVTTDANGDFSTIFTPLQTEAGMYTIAAVAPGITSAPAQDSFTILGVSLTPNPVTLSVTEGGGASSAVTVQNLSEVPLTGLTASISGTAQNITASTMFTPNFLTGQGSATLIIHVSASDSTIRQSSFNVHITSTEGVALDLPVNVTVVPLVAQLSVVPSQLNSAMLRGAQTSVQFEILNLGGAASGPLTVSAPAAPWLTIATTNPLPSLPPGGSNMVTVLLTPTTDLALGPYTGALTVSGSGIGVTVPFTFNCVSDGHGNLRVHSVDELTFFATNSPPLTNASVTLIDPLSRSVVATGVTDATGQFIASNVMEGVYELDVTATQHASFKGSATVTAGTTTDVETFLSMQTVTYTWTVVPTQIQDVTHITVQAEFEANVPAPVVVPTPASLDLASLQQPGQFMDVPLTLANYGLIAVHSVTINISDNPNYQFDLLTKNIGDLPAHGTVTVPMRITRVANTGLRPTDDDCEVSISIGYLFLCGQYDISTGIPIPVFNVTGDCGTPTGGAGGTIVFVGCDGCTGGPINIPPGQSSPSTCDQCLAKAIVECGIGYTPAGCAYGGWSCFAGLATQGFNATTGENCVVQGVGCLGPIGNTVACLWSILRCKCGGALSTVPSCVSHALGGGSRPLDLTTGEGLSPVDPMDVYIARSYSSIQMIQMIINDTDGHWFAPGSGGAFGAFFSAFNQAIQSDSPSGIFISPDEFNSLMAMQVPSTVSGADVVNMLNRWNLSISNWVAGVYSPTNVAPGGNTNFISLYDMSALALDIGQQYQASQAAGYADPVAGFFGALQSAESMLGGEGTCAKVVLQLDQDAVLTRDAFSATLQLNNSGGTPLENVKVNLVVQNAAGQDVSSLFGIEAPTLTGELNAVNGTGELLPNSAGTAQWTLIPTIDAAPQAPTNYFVSGSLNYTLNGVAVSLPLSPASISVQPNPQLYVKYFHQRDVYADDPTTPQIEPSIPYSLAVMVQNRGYGTAYDFHITSAQPQIVDNEKGLLVNFQIIGAQVGNQPVSPSLTVDFGDILPNDTVVGRWLLTSTLQGLFINYSATFEHVDPLGNPRLSLIDGVEIHEMNHLVQAEGAFDDGLPDFLVNDIADFNYLPDTLYLSDGRIEPVSVVETATPDAPAGNNHLQVQLNATFPSGFTYVQVPDPANGQFPLVGVIHSNGTNMNTNNFWTTDRTFIGLGQPPIHENLLHLMDYHTNAGPYTYILVYALPSSIPQTNAPISAVFALPPFSPSTFGVVWSGANLEGQAPLAFYDIYASDNNSPFTVWQPHTTQTGALYSGQPGHTYSFYSIATDTAGNVEAPPATPDATTTVSLSNTPPTISFASNRVTINEGDTLSLTPRVSDSDVPQQTFTFKLGSGAPANVTINSSTGILMWPTTELDGPSTNTINVIVTDNGFPPLSSTGSVTVIVNEVNQSPILSPIGNYTIAEGFLLRITNSAVDYDIPTNALTFSLGNPVPTGASIDSHTGIFSWRPTDTQGPSTNLIKVVVTDNGVPSLSATQTFSVIVLDTLSDITLSIGSTNVFAGESNNVPVVLADSLQLTNVNLQLTAPGSQLTNLALRGISAEVSGISLIPNGTNTYTVGFNLNPALQTASTRSLATLNFQTITNYHSSVAKLGANQVMGEDTTGKLITNTTGINGQVIIVGREPVLGIKAGTPPKLSLLDLNSNAPPPSLTLYGRPGAIYGLLMSTNLATNHWTEIQQFVQSGRAMTLSLSNSSLPEAFFNILEVKAPPPMLSINRTSNTLLSLQLSGFPGTLYGLETSSALGTNAVWSPLSQITLTNSSQTIILTNKGEPGRFFRGTVP